MNSEKLANILLVEDSLPEILLAKDTLSRDHVKVNLFAVRDGTEAIEYLTHENGFSSATHPDIILLDLNMPSMDGREVLSYIKKNQTFRNIPVVIYSGSDTSSDIAEAKALGAIDYIVKPLSYKKLQKMLQNITCLEFHEDQRQRYLVRLETRL